MQEILAKIASELFDPEFDFIKDFQEYCGQVSIDCESYKRSKF